MNSSYGGFEWVGGDSDRWAEMPENVITQMVISDGTVVTAIASDFPEEKSEETHDIIFVPGKKEAVLMVNKEFIHEVIMSNDTPFGAGFAFGVFIGQVSSEVGDSISAKGPNDDWKL
jgi:hypothetical protein